MSLDDHTIVHRECRLDRTNIQHCWPTFSIRDLVSSDKTDAARLELTQSDFGELFRKYGMLFP